MEKEFNFQTFGQIIESNIYKFYIFDCDGVLWTGRHVINKSMQTLYHLITQPNIKVFFLSNNANLNRE